MTTLDFQPGDIVRFTGTAERVAAGAVYAIASTGDGGAWLHPSHLEMVKRAVRKPKVGDKITARQVCDIHWKRGTLLRNRVGDLLALNAEAQWIPLGEHYPRSFEFSDILDTEGDGDGDGDVYEVAFLP